jgi:hypothetical protein
VALALAATAGPAPLAAQAIQTVDPNKTINSDLAPPPAAAGYRDPGQTAPADAPLPPAPEHGFTGAPPPAAAPQAAPVAAQGDTYKEDDLIGAAEGVFGKGAQGVAKMIQGILKKQGEPNGYIVGREAGGANAGSTFVLVYNLNDTDQLYKRYPAGEGDAYVVGGLTASYLRKGNVVLIPIRVGAGLRLGVNAGYMKFSRKQRWLPF